MTSFFKLSGLVGSSSFAASFLFRVFLAFSREHGNYVGGETPGICIEARTLALVCPVTEAFQILQRDKGHCHVGSSTWWSPGDAPGNRIEIRLRSESQVVRGRKTLSNQVLNSTSEGSGLYTYHMVVTVKYFFESGTDLYHGFFVYQFLVHLNKIVLPY